MVQRQASLVAAVARRVRPAVNQLIIRDEYERDRDLDSLIAEAECEMFTALPSPQNATSFSALNITASMALPSPHDASSLSSLNMSSSMSGQSFNPQRSAMPKLLLACLH